MARLYTTSLMPLRSRPCFSEVLVHFKNCSCKYKGLLTINVRADTFSREVILKFATTKTAGHSHFGSVLRTDVSLEERVAGGKKSFPYSSMVERRGWREGAGSLFLAPARPHISATLS